LNFSFRTDIRLASKIAKIVLIKMEENLRKSKVDETIFLRETVSITLAGIE